ncbi:hypothetical protein HPO96_10105 [Kribbella sandramycini]|uniref:Uncharacterized protein n=1 Tax=Kribbella sandramycini TaxID=60450 RepID=A0A7Y4KXQ9_9ACTN|nr:hypothetical protein [Kribbella sandramycini]MBB6569569.1 hypothetical protein [Kribbella sandramycini]NOL40597.1 hypothetical protein [Kribbella sandramycini]
MSSVIRVLAVAALGISAVGVTPVVAQATADGTQALKITRIKCHETEDNTGADDIYLMVDGSVIMNSIQFTNGDDKDIPDIPIEAGKVLTVMESDWPDANDNLGAKRINGPGNYEFTDDGAHYTVTVG